MLPEPNAVLSGYAGSVVHLQHVRCASMVRARCDHGADYRCLILRTRKADVVDACQSAQRMQVPDDYGCDLVSGRLHQGIDRGYGLPELSMSRVRAKRSKSGKGIKKKDIMTFRNNAYANRSSLARWPRSITRHGRMRWTIVWKFTCKTEQFDDC